MYEHICIYIYIYIFIYIYMYSRQHFTQFFAF